MRSKNRRVRRCTEPAERGADLGNVEPERADELALRRVTGIDEAVVVSLEEVVPVLDQDDPVQHRLMDHRALVQHDVADVVRRLRTHERAGRYS